MDPISRVVAAGAAGAGAAGAALYVDDVFSTYLYDGTGAAQTITNGIDLSGEGGMVWTKSRTGVDHHSITDTERGYTKRLRTNVTNGENTYTNSVTSFNSDGFSLGTSGQVNQSGSDFASWTFRKAPGFFDVVTYTGNGTAGRTVSHNLGSVPGFIIVKELSTASWWICYHRSTGNDYALYLNRTDAADGPNKPSWNQTSPTSTEFTVGVDGYHTNDTNITYVAYLFAHDDQSFGTDSNEAIIKCGSYTGNGSSSGPVVNLGFEPQFIITKNTTDTGNWYIFDVMRGVPVGGNPQTLAAQSSNAEEDASWAHIDITPTGFQIKNTNGNLNTSGSNYIYIAIRRPHKPPEAGTDVFDIEKLSGSQSSPAFRTGIVTDMGWARRLNDGDYYGDGVGVYDRLRGDKYLATGSTAAEGTDTFDGDYMNGFYTSAISGDIGYSFKRAPGFFDIVTYSGTGASRSVSHNLGVAPELIIVKRRDSTEAWGVDLVSESENGRLNTTAAFGTGLLFNNGITSTTISTTNIGSVHNASGADYIAYLFATRAGISKVGVYAGQTGTAKNIDCGFTAGARFVLIKNISTLADWYLWDSTRGIVSGNDPFLYLNASSAEVTNTDYIDPLNAGFTITSSAPIAINRTNQNFLFLAIA